MWRVEAVRRDSGAVHERVAVCGAALRRVGRGRARGQHIPIQVVIIRTFLGHGSTACIARFLHAEEEGEPVRNILFVSAGFVIVLHRTIFPHISTAFSIAMLASESVSSISVFFLIGIAVGESLEEHDLTDTVESGIDLLNGVRFTPWSH